jgi:hypothetical protein
VEETPSSVAVGFPVPSSDLVSLVSIPHANGTITIRREIYDVTFFARVQTFVEVSVARVSQCLSRILLNSMAMYNVNACISAVLVSKRQSVAWLLLEGSASTTGSLTFSTIDRLQKIT